MTTKRLVAKLLWMTAAAVMILHLPAAVMAHHGDEDEGSGGSGLVFDMGGCSGSEQQ